MDHKVVDISFGHDFSLTKLYEDFALNCPHTCQILKAVATTKRQKKVLRQSEKVVLRKQTVSITSEQN